MTLLFLKNNPLSKMTFSKQQISISNPDNRTLTFNLEDVIADLFPFLEKYLPNFPQYLKLTDADEAEKSITQELASFLNSCDSRIGKYYFDFRNEHKPNKSHRSFDIGLLLTANTYGNKLIFIFEAKRLPPDNSTQRQYEYLIGKKGGIERFKTKAHSNKYNITTNGMFGFIQKESTTHWLSFLNSHIEKLETNPTDTEVQWSKNEQLEHKNSFGKVDYLLSKHPSESDTISLHHYWIDLQ
jgi:hypothetical protein